MLGMIMPSGKNYVRDYSMNGEGKYDKARADKNRARKRARYALEKAGIAKKGDGKDVDHKDGNPKNNSRSNLRLLSKAANRSINRNKNAEKA
jgi:hypothetical protein